MLSPLIRIRLSRIIPFGLIWLGFSIVYSLLERGLLGNLNYYPSTGNPYHFSRGILITDFTAFILGLLIGTVETLYLHQFFIRMSFFKKILCKTLLYCAIVITFLSLITLLFNSAELGKGIFDKQVWDNFRLFFFNYAFWSVEIYIAAIIVISLFYSEVSANLGQGVLNNFFTGKYHRPTEEERIFMFLDMKSSTTIAEHLGHMRYFELLKEYYADLTNPIIQNAGEIYQYVGDEVVVSWKRDRGLQNNHCIQSFFAIKAAMAGKEKKYRDLFGLLPEFKAGFHIGKVITGEIGVVKREIIFTGDVLNTTARIQGLCNQYQVDLLISGQLMKQLTPDERFYFRSLGENELRGRDEKIDLFTIEFPDSKTDQP